MKWICKNCKPANPCILSYTPKKNVKGVLPPHTCPWGFITPSSGKNWKKVMSKVEYEKGGTHNT